MVVSPGKDGRLGTGDDRLDPVTTATYDTATRTVTLELAYQLHWNDPARVRILTDASTGVTDIDGNALDGDGDGQAGGDFFGWFARGLYTQISSPTSWVRQWSRQATDLSQNTSNEPQPGEAGYPSTIDRFLATRSTFEPTGTVTIPIAVGPNADATEALLDLWQRRADRLKSS